MHDHFRCSCRATEWPFWFEKLLPFSLIYIFDWTMFILIMTSICKHAKGTITNANDSASKQRSTSLLPWLLLLCLALDGHLDLQPQASLLRKSLSLSKTSSHSLLAYKDFLYFCFMGYAIKRHVTCGGSGLG